MARRTILTPAGREWEVTLAGGVLPPWRATAIEPSESESEVGYAQRSLIAVLFGA